MPLPTPNLDDRHFQDIVDEAKRLIPRFCPEWTDHNVSDPGVALIELFAWMTDLLLYRVNQVPDKVYITLLNLIGIQLEPPQSAVAPVTFYLSAPQETAITIPADTEVATVRTETSPAIIFTTETDLTIHPAVVADDKVYTRQVERPNTPASWRANELRQLLLPNGRIAMFAPNPLPHDAFYIPLRHNHGNHVLALVVDCDVARGAGVDPTNPPLVWEVWQGGVARWSPCEVEFDGTGGFNMPGEIVLHLPPMAPDTIQGVTAHWLRCRLTDAQADTPENRHNRYKVSPELLALRVESRGGTVNARHAVTVRNEVIGRSDGTPGQEFQLLNRPVLSRDPQRDILIVDPPLPGRLREWVEVPDFAASGPDDQHYTLDSLSGTVSFGPALLQPDGAVRNFGSVPPHGSVITMTRYQYGGGVVGNVQANTLVVLKTSIPYVSRVTNRRAAEGGRDPQGLDDARVRAPQILRTRTRAVTADDYEHLAREVVGVARACCIAPGAQPGGPADPRPGQVLVCILPQTDNPIGRIPPEALTLSAELRARVLEYLDRRRPLGIALDVRPVQYLWVSVEVRLRVPARSDQALIRAVQQDAEETLYRYLNPYVGGPQGDGWPFGRDLHVSEIYALMQRLPQIEFVEEVQIGLTEPGSTAKPQVVSPRLDVPRHALICSWQHRVSVSAS